MIYDLFIPITNYNSPITNVLLFDSSTLIVIVFHLFIPSTLEKIEQVRELIDDSGYDIQLEVDGGVKVDNIRQIRTWKPMPRMWGAVKYWEGRGDLPPT